MADSYVALVKNGTDEIVEKKSRFIGYTFYVESEEEAFSYIEQIRKKHYDARHNCYAFSIGTELPNLRFSDDGEPQGTAGKPILEVINGSGISNILIVVTRYFGGTLLGTGGLIRAYTDASKAAIAASEVKKFQRLSVCAINSNYSDMGKIQYILQTMEIEITDTEYTDEVVFMVNIPVDMKNQVEKKITEATAARSTVTELDEIFG